MSGARRLILRVGVEALRRIGLGRETASKVAADATLVARIQRGLSKVYADITVDGVAGEGTRQSIRNFEKHYNLPQTGEPNERVLKKLKEIGAL